MEEVTYFPQLGKFQVAILLLIFLISGLLAGPLAYIVIPIIVFFIANRGMYLPIFIGFFFILILASNRADSLAFAENLRPIYLVLLFGFIVLSSFLRPIDKMGIPFIPFFIIAFFWTFISEIPSTGILKTVSYLLMLVVIPTYMNRIYDNYSDEALEYLIYFGGLILSVGLFLWALSSDFVFLAGRYRGLFGNPNGLGIFSFLFMVLLVVIVTHRPGLFTKRQKIIFGTLILISLILSGARTSLAATLIFFLFLYFYRISKPIGVLVLLFIIASYQVILLFLSDVIVALNLETYARLESLQDMSGRAVSFQFAWDQIKENIWIGGGIGFSEELFVQNSEMLSQMGHQGGSHNTFLSIWLDTGIIGLIFFCVAWLINFWKASLNSSLAYPILLAITFSAFFESWLVSSLNAFTILLIIILSLLTNPNFNQQSN